MHNITNKQINFYFDQADTLEEAKLACENGRCSFGHNGTKCTYCGSFNENGRCPYRHKNK